MEPVFLMRDEVIALHIAQIEAFGGSHGVRDEGLLESALAMPGAGFGDDYLHRDVFEMAAAYLFHLVMNHPFVDGNKRTSLHAADVFLRVNGWDLSIEPHELHELVIAVTEGSADKPAIAAAFREHSVPRAE